jgi:hypothetical protein
MLAFFLVSVLFHSYPLVFALASEEWSKTYGGTGYDLAQSMVSTSDGGYAIAGFTNSFGAGRNDAWLVKTDSSGNELWSKTYGGTDDDQAWSVVQTGDGGYALAGCTNSSGAGDYDFYLIKTDSSGNEVWSKTYGGARYDGIESMVVTSDGGYALAGYTISYGTGNNDFWLVKTDSSGNQVWSKTYGGTGYDYAYSVIQTGDGGYALTGFTNSFGGGKPNVLLVKTDSSGNQVWSKTYGGTDDDRAFSVVQTGDGGYAIAGYTNSSGAGDYDFYLIKTDSSGNEVWSKTYGGTYWDGVESMVVTSDGGYALVGYARSFGAGRNDAWLVKTDSSGNELWNKTYGGTVNDYASSVVVARDGGYALAGFTASSGAGGYDFWLIKDGSLVVQPPAFSPVGGTYASIQTVTITCSTEGAIIRYTTDGSEPIATSAVYSSPIEVNSSMVVKAKAFKAEMDDSETTNATYIINQTLNIPKVATPTFSPVGGTYASVQTVTISCSTEGATIRYTTDGSEPSATSTTYSTPIEASSSKVIKAKAFAAEMDPSDTATATYTINISAKIPILTFFPVGGTYASVQTVTISCSTEGATIRYTTDGSEPSATSTLYISPFEVISSMTIKAKAFKEGMIDSDTATATYHINIISPSSLGGDVPPAVMYAAIIIAVAANLVVLVMLLKGSKRKSPSKNA